MTPEIAQKIDQQFSKYPLRTYLKGQILIFADENPEHIFYITKGRVREYDISYRGDEAIVSIFKPPAFFPMSWAINRTPNTYFYKTEEETELHIVPVDDALEFIKANPDVLLDLLSRVYKGMDELLGRMVRLMSGTAQSRLMYEIIIGCRRFGEKHSNGSYTLKTKEVDLAAHCGLSRETVSREIHKLKDSGIISVTNAGIEVNDITALEKKLGAEI